MGANKPIEDIEATLLAATKSITGVCALMRAEFRAMHPIEPIHSASASGRCHLKTYEATLTLESPADSSKLPKASSSE
jgi:hypothetical protein